MFKFIKKLFNKFFAKKKNKVIEDVMSYQDASLAFLLNSHKFWSAANMKFKDEKEVSDGR